MSRPNREKPPFMSMRWLRLQLKGIIWTIVILFLASCFFMYVGSYRNNKRNEEIQRKAEAEEQAEFESKFAIPENIKPIENNPVAYVTYPADTASSPTVTIDVKTLYKRMSLMRGFDRVKSFPIEYRGMVLDTYKENALNELISMALYDLYAQKNNLKPDINIKEVVKRERENNRNNFTSRLREYGLSEEEWGKIYSEQITAQKVTDSILKAEPSKAGTEEALKAYYDSNKVRFALEDEISFKHLLVSANDFKDKASADEAQVKEYFEAHRPEFMSGKRFKVSHILIEYKKSAYKDEIKIADADLQKLYEEKKSDYVIGEKVKARHILIKPINDEADPFPAAKAKIEEIKKRLDNGEDFATVAKETSEDTSASDGGNLGEFGRGVMVAPFEQAAFNSKIGEVTEPVKTQFGYHLIKVEDKIPESIKTFDDVKSELREEIKATKAYESARNSLQEAFANITNGTKVITDYVNYSTAEDGSKKNSGHLPIFFEGTVDENYSADDAKILKDEICDKSGKIYQPIINALNLLKKGDVSSIIETPLGLHLLYLEDILEPKELTALSKDIRDKIKSKLEDEGSVKLAEEKAKELAKTMAGKTLSQIAKEYNGELKDEDITFEKLPFSKVNNVSSQKLMIGIGKFTETGRSYTSEFYKQLVSLVANKDFKGKVVGPFETKLGWNFIEVTEYNGDKYEPFDDEVKTRIRHILTLEPNEEEVKKLYEERKDSYKIPAKRYVRVIRTQNENEANEALKRINDGEIFAIVAQSYAKGGVSFDASAKAVIKDNLKPEIAEAVWALENNQITGVLKSDMGYEIYQYAGKEELGGVKKIGDVIGELKSTLSQQYRREAVESFEKALNAEAKINKVEETLKAIEIK